MTDRNPKYPLPDRSNHKPQQNAGDQFFPEIDTGRGQTIMPDGRPAIVEDWFDTEMRFSCRTFIYSRLGIENWTEDDHYQFVKASGLIDGKSYPYEGAGVSEIDDASGNPVCSVTIVMDEESDD